MRDRRRMQRLGGLEQGWKRRYHTLRQQPRHRQRISGIMRVHLQAWVRGERLRDGQCVYCLLGLDQGRERRHTSLLSTIRHNRRNYRVMHVHMRSRVWRKRVRSAANGITAAATAAANGIS